MIFDNDNLNNMYQMKSMLHEINVLKNKVERLEYSSNNIQRGLEHSAAVQVERLNGYEKKFYEYKRVHRRKNNIDLGKISFPFIKDKVSVILPVFNGEDFIALSIESVLNQTYKYFELIIIDDGSTDSTAEIINKYADRDKRVKVIHQENRKLPRTLSRGFRQASGEFLTWTSADNIMHPLMLEKYVLNMKTYPYVDMFFGNIRLIDETGKAIEDNTWYPDKKHKDYVMLPENVLELNVYSNNYIGAAFMYRFGVAQIIEDYDENRFGIEDYDYWMKINDVLTIRHVDFKEPLYSYRFHSKSLTSRDKELKITEERYLTMEWDNTRRDYFVKPLVWVLGECDDNLKTYKKGLIQQISRAGHIFIPPQKVKETYGEHYYNYVYVNFGDIESSICNNLPRNTFKVLIQEKVSEIKDRDKFNCYICLQQIDERDNIRDYKGWFGIPDPEQTVAFIDSKSKIQKVADLGGTLREGYKAQLTFIILSNGNKEILNSCLNNIRDSKEIEDEVLVIVNRSKSDNVLDIVKRFPNFKMLISYSNKETNMINLGIWNAKGKYISILAEDCYIQENYCRKIKQAFEESNRVGVICGGVQYKGVLKSERRKYHEFPVEHTEILYGDENYKVGSVNIIIRSSIIKAFGGVRKVVLEDFMDLPDVSILSLIRSIERQGWYILALEGCKVIRKYVSPSILSQKHTFLLSNYIMNKNLVIEKESDLNYIQSLLYKKERIEFRYIINNAKELEKLDAKLVRNEFSKCIINKRESTINIMISVIVPVYNVENYIENCVASLLNQTFTDYEILLIDDGSTDSSGELCDNFAEKYEPIKVYHKQNGGLSDARNYGLNKAEGEYIIFIDSDDWIDEDTLRILYLAAVTSQADIAECSYRSVFKEHVDEETENTGIVISGSNVFAIRNQMNWKYFKSIAWNKLYHRKVFMQNIRYPIGKFHEDEFVTHQLFYNAEKLVYVDYSAYNYNRIREESITATVTTNILDSCYALRERVNFICKNNITELEKKVKNLYCWFLFDRIHQCYNAGVRDNKLDDLIEMASDEYEEVMNWDITEKNKLRYSLLVGSYKRFNEDMSKED